MAEGYIHGKMAGNMMATIMMIKKTGTGSINGLMVINCTDLN